MTIMAEWVLNVINNLKSKKKATCFQSRFNKTLHFMLFLVFGWVLKLANDNFYFIFVVVVVMSCTVQ